MRSFLLLTSLILLALLWISLKDQSFKKIAPNSLIYNTKTYQPSLVSLDKIFSDKHIWVASLSAINIRTILITGDVIPARSVNQQASLKGDFLWPYRKVADFVKNADITFINLETPLLQNCPIITSGFSFCGSSKHIEGLKLMGVDIVTLANNHSGNFREEGVKETTKLLRDNEILVIGIEGEENIVIKDIRGIKFAFLGYNDIGVSNGVSNTDLLDIRENILEAKERGANVVIVQFHWGIEYRSEPDERQKMLGRYTIDQGADLVIGNHPHWVQPVEIYKNRLITYAHGNFIFDQEWSQKTKEGVVGKYIFYGNQLIDVEYFPIEIKNFGQPYFLEGEHRKRILDEMYKESLELSL